MTYTKTYTCKRCGIIYTVEYNSLRSMAQSRRAYCDECALIVRKEQQQELYKRRKAKKGLPDRSQFSSNDLSSACDRFFVGRGMANDADYGTKPLPAEAIKPKDIVDAVNYGESAFDRYKKLSRKKGTNQNEQT